MGLQPFLPLTRNPHLLTIFGNFAKRRLDVHRFPVRSSLFETEPGVRIRIESQRPPEPALGEIVMVHGLEGSSEAGYMRSMSQLALEEGFAVHRTNMRSCGGTDEHTDTMYHAGLTSDTLSILRHIRTESQLPLFLIGYSLGGNVSLKLAGELAETGPDLLRGVCAVSTPIDLGACVRKMSELQNRIYEWRFLSRLKQRIRRRALCRPDLYTAHGLAQIRSVYEFDDRITARFFGFGSADNYYATQSSRHFLSEIRVPTLLVQAKDDPLIPFQIFGEPAIHANKAITLLAVEHGGHLGFLAKAAPRFWVDRVILQWIKERVLAPYSLSGANTLVFPGSVNNSSESV